MSRIQTSSGSIGASNQWLGLGAGCVNDVLTSTRPLTPQGSPNGSPIYPEQLAGQASWSIGITGTWTGTIVFEVSSDGVTWTTALACPFGGGSGQANTTANGFFVASCANCTGVRARFSSYTNGTAQIMLMATDAPASIGASLQSSGSSTSKITSVNSSISSVVLLSANPARSGFIINNNGGFPIDIALAPVASATSYTASVAGGGVFQMPNPVDYTGVVSGVWLNTSGTAVITELSP